MIHRLEEIRNAGVYGIRPLRTFRDAAIKYMNENRTQRSIADRAQQLKFLDPYIGTLSLEKVHIGSLQKFISDRKSQGVKARTINSSLEIVRRILNLAASEWMDENGLTWIANAPKIKLLSLEDTRKPCPLSWEEQDKLFALLPGYLRKMVLFKVNTGLRDQEVCKLKWEWEHHIPELNTSVFIIPAAYHKNKEDRLVVLNHTARQVIESVRGQNKEYVFVYNSVPIGKLNNRAWKKARAIANLPVRIHDLKHTFGRRLRAAGVSFEDRQDLLGHKSGRITTHYSSAEIGNLIEAVNKICRDRGTMGTLTLLRQTVTNLSQPVRLIAANAR